MHAKALQSCLTLCDPVGGSPPGCPVHRILQARVLEWVAMASSGGSSQPKDQVLLLLLLWQAGSLPLAPPGKPLKWSISCHINKQGCQSHQLFRPSRRDFLSLEGTQKEQRLGSNDDQGTKDVKKQITGFWPQIAEIHMKGMISVSPDSCIFPDIEKQ